MKRYLRLISRLDVKGQRLVKGINLEGLRMLGDPEAFAKVYADAGIDELFYMDVVASLYERNSLGEMISRVARNNFVPITVGGGLRRLEDIDSVLSHGADKVSLNTAALRRPELIDQAALKFGSSTIVVTLEVIKQENGSYLCFIDNGREYTGVEAFSWAKEAVSRGAGEIVITSVDREGTGMGFDIELFSKISEMLSVPVVAHGGAGTVDHVLELVKKTKVNGVAIASLFHYQTLNDHPDVGQKNYIEDKSYVKRKFQAHRRIRPCSIGELIDALGKIDVSCRLI